MNKRYIGDGAYVASDGYCLVLTTENGIETTNRIVLGPGVWAALERYVHELRRARRPNPEKEKNDG